MVLTRKVISKKVVCPKCSLSYTGTVAGSLRVLGVDCDIVDVGGYSGYAFIVNVTRSGTDASGPTALGDLWKQIIKGTESLGWTIETYYDPPGCEVVDRDPTSEELKQTKKLFEKVTKEIDEKDGPVVVWGLPVPDYGVAIGYDGDSYIPVTIYGNGKPEEPIPYYRLQAPGALMALFFREKVQQKVAAIGKEAVERACRFASWRAPAPGGSLWVMGPGALDTWADALQNLPDIKEYWSGYGGNSYVAQCVHESRHMAAEFLKRLSTKYPGKQSGHLLEAAKCYEKERGLMEGFLRIFPYEYPPPPHIEINPEHLDKGAETLRRIKPFEEEAVKHMRKALEEWET